MLPTDESSEGEVDPQAKSQDSPVRTDDGKSSKLVKGFVFGIGSAALVAVLLYAGRIKSKKSPWR